jgi:ABC-type antimicrobial peptide transport system permease subunit
MGLVLSAVAFSTLVGLIAGYSPANRAMKLSALDAIRTE